MPIPASKRRNNDIYNAKCDRISARPLKPVGNAIRAAAQKATAAGLQFESEGSGTATLQSIPANTLVEQGTSIHVTFAP